MAKDNETYSVSVVAKTSDPMTEDEVRPLQKLGVAARIAASHDLKQRLVPGNRRITLKIEGRADELNDLLEDLRSARVEVAS